MTLLLITLAYGVPICELASDSCTDPAEPCVYLQGIVGPSCVDWDVDAGAIVVLPGGNLQVNLVQATALETVHVGLELAALPEDLIDYLPVGPTGGPGATHLTLDAAGHALTIRPQLVPDLHNVKVVDAELVLKGARLIGAAGGCISADEAVLEVEGGSIEGCSDDSGGAIYADGGTTEVRDTDFFDNHADTNGGDIWSSGTLSLWNTDHEGFSADNNGGSIRFSGQDLTVDGSTFNNGEAPYGNGGVLHVTQVATGTAHIVRTHVTDTSAARGGALAIAASSGAALVVEDSTIEDAQADEEGGALFIGESVPLVTLSHTTVRSAEAPVGGAVSTYGDLELASSTIEDSRSDDAGGAIYATSDAKLDIRNSGFLRNRADYGGALGLEDVVEMNIEGSWFCQNLGDVQGGDVWMGDAANDVMVRHTLFFESQSPSGPVWQQGGGATVSMEHVALHAFAGEPVDDDAGYVAISDSVLAGTAWNGWPGVGNVVFDGFEPVLFYGAPSPCGAPFQLHPILEPAHDGPQLDYEASGVWSMEGNYGPFGLNPSEQLDTLDGLLDPAYVTVAADPYTDERLPAVDWYNDGDGDGFPAAVDCNDADANSHPAANERCFDGVDNDCDGRIDTADDNLETYFLDEDQDGSLEKGAPQFDDCMGDETTLTAASDVILGIDCDPDESTVFEGAEEICDGIDNDCDGLIDGLDDDATGDPSWYLDSDGDGWARVDDAVPWCGSDDEALASGLVQADRLGDCEPSDPTISPGAAEICNGIDDDCSGKADDAEEQVWLRDPDGDQHVMDEEMVVYGCIPEDEPYVLPDNVLGFDCDEERPDVNASAPEVCGDDVDNDCNPATDDLAEATLYYPDGDGDGYGLLDAEGVWYCPGDAAGRRLSETNDDCDDILGTVNPGAFEIVDNGIDEDCSGDDVQSYIAGGCSTASPRGLSGLLARRR